MKKFVKFEFSIYEYGIYITKFQREHLKTTAINTYAAFILLAFTELILFLNKLTLLMMTA